MTHAASRDRRRPVDDGGNAIGLRSEDSSVHNAARGAQIVIGGNPWMVVAALILGALGFTLGLIALVNSSQVADIAADAARAAAKAETATARANTAEIYSYQVYTELNRLGYPVRTPAEDHVPQPPNNPPSETP
jgi:hypothetical protein